MAASFGDSNQKLPMFDRVGGRVFTALITERFCDRMLSDPKLEELLRHVDIGKLKKNMTDLACAVLSGDTAQALPILEAVGHQVHISQSLFNRGISHLIAAFVWAGINRELIEEVLDVVTPFSEQLVQPDQAGPELPA